MALSGSVSTTSYEGRYVKLSWTATQSIEDNSSTISWSLKGAGDGQAGWYMAGPFKVVINGSVVYESNTRIKLYKDTTVKTGTKKLTHNDKGEKSFKIEVQAAIYAGSYNKSGSKIFELNTIPRKATITSASDFYDTSSPIIKYQNLAGNNIKKLEIAIYHTDGTSEIIPYKTLSKVNKVYPTSGSYTFNFTSNEQKNLWRACDKSNSINVRIYLRTTIGTTVYRHYVTKKLTIENPSPRLNPTITSSTTTSVTGNKLHWLNNITNINYDFGDEAQKGSTIKSYLVECGNRTATTKSGTLNQVNGATVKFTVVDSRGNKVSRTLTEGIALIKYFVPTGVSNITVTLQERIDQVEGKDESAGNTVTDSSEATFLFKLQGSYYYSQEYQINGASNTISGQYRYKAETATEWSNWIKFNTFTINEGGYIGEAILRTTDYLTAYEFEARIWDNYLTNSKPIIIPKVSMSASPVFDWGKNDFKFNVPIKTAKYKYATVQHELAGSNYADSPLDRYVPSGGGLYLPNSDINGVNGLFFNYDVVNNVGEGIFFPVYPSTIESEAVAYIGSDKKYSSNGTKYQRYGQLYINRSGNLRIILGVIPGVLSLADMHQATSATDWWKPYNVQGDDYLKYQYLVINITGKITTDDTPYGEKDLLYS